MYINIYLMLPSSVHVCVHIKAPHSSLSISLATYLHHICTASYTLTFRSSLNVLLDMMQVYS
jgi:hypothetical protein